jgi:hypothetical protein
MGIDDRDYMRKRYAERQGLRWNERKGRIEYDKYDPIAHAYGRGGKRPAPSKVSLGTGRRFIIMAGAAGLWLAGLEIYERTREEAFPPSGTVAVSTDLSPPNNRGQLQIVGGPHNAVIQLLDPATKTPQFAIFIQANEIRTVEVPAGEWLIRIADGTTWQGPARYFGFWTRYRLAKNLFEFSNTTGHTLNLAETSSGNLPTKRQWFATPYK